MEKLEGLDEELEQEEAKQENNIVSMEEFQKKRKPFHYWTVKGTDHQMKLTTKMITKLENKYHMNITNLITSNDLPPLSVMLTVAQAAIAPWEHGMSYEKVSGLYDVWVDEGYGQTDFLSRVIIPTMAVSGFFTASQAELILKEIEEADMLS